MSLLNFMFIAYMGGPEFPVAGTFALTRLGESHNTHESRQRRVAENIGKTPTIHRAPGVKSKTTRKEYGMRACRTHCHWWLQKKKKKQKMTTVSNPLAISRKDVWSNLPTPPTATHAAANNVRQSCGQRTTKHNTHTWWKAVI